MKRYNRSIQGATLLEIMLVLAVAAMIIVMSIRYYQSASNSQSANSILQQVQAITAAADNLSMSAGGYSAAQVNTSTIRALVGSRNLSTPFGPITVASTGATTFTMAFPAVPLPVCRLIEAQLANNPKTTIANCTGGTTATITYNNTR